MGWRRILTLLVARAGKLKLVNSLLVTGLLTNQKGENFFQKLTDAPFQMEEKSVGIGRKEGESLTGETSSVFLVVHPIAWHRLPARGGDSLQVNPVVLPGHGANGAQCREGGHRDLCDGGEPLCRELPAAAKQPSVGIVGPNRDGEE